MKQVTVVIPVVSRHDEYLPEVFSDLVRDDALVESIVIARSGLSADGWAEYEQWLQSNARQAGLTCAVELSPVSEQAREAPNRNRGWAMVRTEWTAFMDADDRYAPGRLGYLIDVALEENADLMLHDYSRPDEDMVVLPEPPMRAPDVRAVTTEELRTATFGFEAGRRSAGERNIQGNTNVLVPSWSVSQSVHHAHLLVRTTIREHELFRDIFPGSDGDFCQRVLGRFQVTYVPLRLSAYRPENSAYAASSGRIRLLRGRGAGMWRRFTRKSS